MTSSGANIEDARTSDDDDKIRVYGSTSLDKPFKAKQKFERSTDAETISPSDVQFEDDGTESLISSSGSASRKSSSRKSNAGSNPSINRSDDTVSVVSSRSFYHSWWKHPKVRDNCRVVIGAFVLTVIGFVLILVGIGIMVSPFRGYHSLIFFIGGALMVIPGLYHVIIIYLAATGRAGYTFHNISVFS